MEQHQRIDITKQVAKYVQADPRVAQVQAAQAPMVQAAIEAPAPKPKKRYTKNVPSTAKPWYMVIDEIVEGTVTFEAWPWPDVDPATRFLRFDLSKTKNKTMDLSDLQNRVNKLRADTEKDAAATGRPLRIGDVFKIDASDITKLGTWRKVTDDTERKRKEAQAAMHAMAAPIIDPKRADELEKLARAAQDDSPTSNAEQVQSARAFPAV